MQTIFAGRAVSSALTLCLALIPALGACAPADDAPSEATATEAARPGAEAPAEKPDPASLDLVERTAVAVLPAPSEIAAAVEGQAGFDLERLAAEPLPTYEALPAWRTPLAVGRVVADLLIAAPSAPTSDIVAYLDNLVLGLRAMGVEDEQIAEVEALRGDVAAGALGRDELIDRFDRLRIEILEQGKKQLGERDMALVAAGGWARAVNLVSERILETGEVPERADALKLRFVVTTLIDRLGDGGEVRPVVESLQAILPITAQRPSEPTREELTTLVAETEEILALTRAS